MFFFKGVIFTGPTRPVFWSVVVALTVMKVRPGHRAIYIVDPRGLAYLLLLCTVNKSHMSKTPFDHWSDKLSG